MLCTVQFLFELYFVHFSVDKIPFDWPFMAFACEAQSHTRFNLENLLTLWKRTEFVCSSSFLLMTMWLFSFTQHFEILLSYIANRLLGEKGKKHSMVFMRVCPDVEIDQNFRNSVGKKCSTFFDQVRFQSFASSTQQQPFAVFIKQWVNIKMWWLWCQISKAYNT